MNNGLPKAVRTMPKDQDKVTSSAGRKAAALGDGPVAGALLPLARINGELFVAENCLHFFPPVTVRPTGPEAPPRFTAPEGGTGVAGCMTESKSSAPAPCSQPGTAEGGNQHPAVRSGGEPPLYP
jgi:hypothetical protein